MKSHRRSRAVLAISGVLMLIAAAPIGAQRTSGVSHYGDVQARSGASVRQSPQRIRTSFDMSAPRTDTRVSRQDLTNQAVPIPRQMQGIGQGSSAAPPQDQEQSQSPDNQSRVRVLGAGGDQTVASVRQSRASVRREREREQQQVQAPSQPLPSYVQYSSSTSSTFDFSVPPPVGGVVCDGLPLGADRFSHDGTTYYAYAGSCLTRIYDRGAVCYRVVACPPR